MRDYEETDSVLEQIGVGFRITYAAGNYRSYFSHSHYDGYHFLIALEWHHFLTLLLIPFFVFSVIFQCRCICCDGLCWAGNLPFYWA